MVDVLNIARWSKTNQQGKPVQLLNSSSPDWNHTYDWVTICVHRPMTASKDCQHQRQAPRAFQWATLWLLTAILIWIWYSSPSFFTIYSTIMHAPVDASTVKLEIDCQIWPYMWPCQYCHVILFCLIYICIHTPSAGFTTHHDRVLLWEFPQNSKCCCLTKTREAAAHLAIKVNLVEVSFHDAVLQGIDVVERVVS